MNLVKVSSLDAAGNRSPPDAASRQLPPSDDPMLTFRQHGERSFALSPSLAAFSFECPVNFYIHRVHKLNRYRFLPPALPRVP